VHALLGNLPTKTTAEKRHRRKHTKILHATLILTRTKKTVTTKTFATKNGLDQTKPQTNLKNNFGKPDTTKRQKRQRNREHFTNLIYQNLCEKKTSRFWELTKPTTNKAKATKQSQSKPTLTKTWPKTLKPILATRQNKPETLLIKENLLSEETRTWKPAYWKPDSNLDLKNTAAKKLILNFWAKHKTNFAIQRRICFLYLVAQRFALPACGRAWIRFEM